uniref:hypothetical protein n=1 Tax=Streptomyces sp. Tue6028 TaxID=2036037 RepID=UPI003EC1184D
CCADLYGGLGAQVVSTDRGVSTVNEAAGPALAEAIAKSQVPVRSVWSGQFGCLVGPGRRRHVGSGASAGTWFVH